MGEADQEETAGITSEDEREAGRLAALEHLCAVRPEADHVLQGLADEVRDLFGTDLSMVNLILSDELYFRAWSGELPTSWVEARRTSREGEMCDYVAETEGPLVMPDLSATEKFVDHPIHAVYGLRFYAGTPLVTSAGHHIGILCVVDREPREDFGEKDLAVLEAFARAVVGRLELLGALERERGAREDAVRRGSELEKALVEREEAEEELSAVYQRLDSHVENSPLGVVEWDRNLKVLRWSEGAERIFGWTAEEVVGRTISELPWIHEEDEEAVGDLVFDRLLSGDERRVVFHNRNYKKDGSVICCEWYSSVLVDGSGELVSVMSLAMDVTERAEAEKGLKESEERYHALTDATLEGIVILDQERILEANRAFAAMFGYERPEELAGRSVIELTAPESVELVRRNVGTGYDEPYEAVGLRRDGTRFHKEVYGRASTYRDRPVRVTSVRDVTERKRAEESLKESEERYRAVVEQSVESIFLFDPETKRVLECNTALQQLLGYTPEELSGMEIYDFIAHEKDDIDENVRRDLRERRRFVGERKYRRKDGFLVDVEVSMTVIPYDSQEVLCAVARDVTGRKEAEEAIKRSEERFRSLVRNASDVITILDESGTVLYESPAIERVLGYRPEEMVGRDVFGYIHPEDLDRTRRSFSRVMADSQTDLPPVRFRFRHADGSWRCLEGVGNNLLDDPSVRGFVVNSRDVTERTALEERLTHQAFHDALTDLPNRYLFMDRLSHALDRAQRREGSVAVLFLDLDNFKYVNDSLGHEAGDEMLVAVAERLGECLRPGDTVARLGGDEFGVLIEDAADEGIAAGVARRITEELRNPIALGENEEVFVEVSIGIAFGEAGGDRPEGLLRRADVAMYEAKRKGKAQAEVFAPRMDARVLERLKLETDLRRAIEREEFSVHYQPKVYLGSGRIVGFEALVRWERPGRGLISPADFIPVAEETGLIVPIGRYVLKEACRRVMQWSEASRGGYPPGALAVCINLSARQFQQKDLAHDVLEALEASGLPPGSLILEITESVVMEDAPLTARIMRELKALGVRLAIDDFGTGYSSLSYLRRFPADYLKIDRAFVGGLGENPEDRLLVEGVIALAHTLGLKVIAEGVETAEQLVQLQEMECELGQGYYFSKPLPLEAASQLLSGDRLRP